MFNAFYAILFGGSNCLWSERAADNRLCVFANGIVWSGKVRGINGFRDMGGIANSQFEILNLL